MPVSPTPTLPDSTSSERHACSGSRSGPCIPATAAPGCRVGDPPAPALLLPAAAAAPFLPAVPVAVSSDVSRPAGRPAVSLLSAAGAPGARKGGFRMWLGEAGRQVEPGLVAGVAQSGWRRGSRRWMDKVVRRLAERSSWATRPALGVASTSVMGAWQHRHNQAHVNVSNVTEHEASSGAA